jgi:hypothetical protein
MQEISKAEKVLHQANWFLSTPQYFEAGEVINEQKIYIIF